MKLRIAVLVALALLVTPGFAQTKPPLSSRAEKAIDAGCFWLLRHQGADGSWSALSLKETCDGAVGCDLGKDEKRDIYGEGLTALAALVLLREGVKPGSTKKLVDPLDRTTYVDGEALTKALAWLAKTQAEDGSFGRSRPFLYNHSLATLVFAEAARITKDPGYADAAQKGLAYLEGAQKPNPNGEGLWGWRYASRQDIEARKATLTSAKYAEELKDADTSVTGWASLALHAGRDAGLVVHDENIAGAARFLDAMTRLDGKVGYVDAEQAGMKVLGERDSYDYHPGTLSALGIHVHLLAGTDRKHVFFQRASDELFADLPRVDGSKKSVDYYYWYQGTLALDDLQHTAKGKFAKNKAYRPWYTATAESLLELASAEEKSCSRGGWIVHDRWCYTGGPTYATTFALLTLQLCRAAL
ncbi:MAG: hypothetical protein HZA52_06870 [Planctomycetes bacterium]|nr:hypothetical protein [Planctomycetota bacterium]